MGEWGPCPGLLAMYLQVLVEYGLFYIQSCEMYMEAHNYVHVHAIFAPPPCMGPWVWGNFCPVHLLYVFLLV